jgi:hypothetical protein
VSVLESMGSGHNRELTRKQKLHPAAAASMRLQNAILERQNAEIFDHGCQQAEAPPSGNLHLKSFLPRARII